MTQELILAESNKVVNPSITEDLSSKLADLNSNAISLLDQAQRAVVDSEKTLAMAGDLHKVIRGQENSAETYRKKLIAPVRGWLDLVNALFKVSKTTRDEAASIIKQKADKFQRARELEARQEAERLRKLAEEQAIRDAELAAAAGDNLSADAILEIGADISENIEKGAKPELVRGDYGATVGTRTVIKGEVGDVAAFLRAVADGIPGAPWNTLLQFSPSGLNTLARQLNESGESIPGFTVKHESSTSFR